MIGRIGIAVMAQGVETETQLALLRKSACTDIQGVYFSSSLSTADVEPRLSRGRIAVPLRVVS